MQKDRLLRREIVKVIRKVLTTGLTTAILAVLLLLVGLNVDFINAKADGVVNIESCVIDENDHGTVHVKTNIADVYAGDGRIYLYALNVYDDSLEGYAPIAAVDYYGNGVYDITTALNYNTEQSVLYKKFVIVANQDGFFNKISDYHYITNPEVLAENTQEKYVGPTKKGISAAVSDMKELNADNGLLEIPLEEVLMVPEGGRTIPHTYDGFTVYLNNGIVHYYDMVIDEMYSNGMAVNVGLTGAYDTAMPDLLYPGVDYTVETDNYGLNTGNKIGTQYVAAVIDFFAERYSTPGSGHGVVSNWLIGNEVNDEKTFYYIGANGIDDFVEKYMQTFRVAYNIIRSHYSNADIFMRMANLWYVVQDTDNFAGKKYLEKFNDLGCRQGNIDWSVSYHPYSCPLTDANVLDDDDVIVRDYFSKYIGYAEHNFTTFEITMLNIDVLVDFLKQDAFLNQNGELRTINLSEQGYISQTEEGEDQQVLQAASMAYAYYKALSMPEIESVFFYRYQDDPAILARYPYWKFGLKDVDGNKRFAYYVYKYLNQDNSLEVTDFAKQIFGISSWQELLPQFDESVISTYKTSTEEHNLYSTNRLTKDNVLFSNMLGNWTSISNILAWGTVSKAGEVHNDRGWAITYDEGDAHEYAAIKHDFDEPLDLTKTPYIGFDFEVDLDSYNKSQNITNAEVVVRLTSNGNTYDASGVIEVGPVGNYFSKPYTLVVNAADWEYANSVDSIEIWVNQVNSKDIIAAEIMVYDVRLAANAEDAGELAVLDKAEAAKTDLSGAQVNLPAVVNWTGSKINPEISVVLDGRTLTYGVDYGVNYYENVESGGNARAVVYGINSYKGTVVSQFGIIPPIPVYNGVDYSAVFNVDYYYNHNLDLKVEIGYDFNRLLEHFVNNGMAEGRCAKEDFNVMYYKNALQNDDLREALGDDIVQYYYHYINAGQYEGRATSSWDAVFDPEYYFAANSDVYDVIVAVHSEWGNLDGFALDHFCSFGVNEARKGKADFDVLNYEAANPDVWMAYGSDYRQAAIHYIQFGAGRNTQAGIEVRNVPENHPDVAAAFGFDYQAWINWYNTYRDYIYNDVDYSGVYNPDDYAMYNPDVAAAFGDNKQAMLWHFVNYGMSEGRYALTSFNVVKYMYGILNDDLRRAFGENMSAYYYHYMNYGRYEGRSVSDYDAIFDAEYYLDTYPDVKECIVNRYTADGNLYGWALWHYYEYGMNECRRPNADFSVLNYMGANPDIFNAYGDDYRAATIQYLTYGIYEGRSTHALIDISKMKTIRPDVVEAYGNDPTGWVRWYVDYGRFE